MTLPPAAANRSSILALTAGDAPQPQSSPKVIVPSATSEIRTPDLPKSLYLMRFPHFFGWATTSGQRGPQVPGSAGRLRSGYLHFNGEISTLTERSPVYKGSCGGTPSSPKGGST